MQDEDLIPKRNKSDIFLRDLLLCRFSVTSIQRCFLLPTAIKLQLFHSIFAQLLFLNFLFPSTSSILPFPMIFSLTYLSTLPSSQSGLPGEAIWKLTLPCVSECPLNSLEGRYQIDPSYYYHHHCHTVQSILLVPNK